MNNLKEMCIFRLLPESKQNYVLKIISNERRTRIHLFICIVHQEQPVEQY